MKAAHKKLVKSITGVNFINILLVYFLNKSALRSFSLISVWLWQKNIGAKAARKMLMKLTLGFFETRTNANERVYAHLKVEVCLTHFFQHQKKTFFFL